ncbi:hypothetical protein [Pseudomonas sp. NPDC086251]|uniref:hypothetical protein n=1 Tax=Pseudomonas sp. NPDC086251 TaxID=3364431 RepID=UPI0038392615
MSAQQRSSNHFCPGHKSLNSGETPMPLAPSIELSNGERFIPQHYLQYEQTVQTVSEILNDIEQVDHYLLFCGDDEFGLYLQVGSIGPDNYKDLTKRRIVYGRKWRIERYTPTSEVIQTAFLALKKAAEHEVRELVTVRELSSGHDATPFSTHVDLPLMARFPELVMDNLFSLGELPDDWLQGIRFDGRAIRTKDWSTRSNGNAVVDLELDTPVRSKSRSGFGDFTLTVVLDKPSKTSLVHGVMNALIAYSDRRIDEMFRYRGFARFSQAVSPLRIGSLSLASRQSGEGGKQFRAIRAKLSEEVDKRRPPSFGVGALAVRNKRAIRLENALEGHLPIESNP